MDQCWYNNNIGHRGGTSKLKENNKVRIVLADSYLLLPTSLNTLCDVFKTTVRKGVFPHEFVNCSNLNYVGNHPTTNEENWSLKDSCIDYLVNDLKSLYEVLFKFEKVIRTHYQLFITDYISMPSLSFAIYRAHFMPENAKIPKLRGKCDQDIRKSYRGGNVEIFKPTIDKDQTGFIYDQNSQFPAAMLNDMPVGVPVHCYNPDITNLFGFFYIEATCPECLNKPFLQTKLNGKTVTPTGTFRGWYFSELIHKAIELGYTIKIFEGYRFERGSKLFTNYVEHFYKLKSTADSSGERYIYKLFLNSFYGKWGMRDHPIETQIMDYKGLSRVANHHELVDIKMLCENSIKNNVIVSYKKEPDYDVCDSDLTYTNLLIKHDAEKRQLNACVAIASATTAYAYLSIYPYLMDEGVIATDTDSLITFKPLPEYLVGSELGQMKLETTFTRGLFVKPKVYFYEQNGVFTYKFKGIPKSLVSYKDYYTLYSGIGVKYYVKRLRKAPGGGLVEVNTEICIAPPDDSKRIRILDADGVWIDTKPITVNNSDQTDLSKTNLNNSNRSKINKVKDNDSQNHVIIKLQRTVNKFKNKIAKIKNG